MKNDEEKTLIEKNKWMIILIFPMYWCYWILMDTPAYVSTTLKQTLNLSNSQYSFFYLAYTIPNIIILPIVPWFDKMFGHYLVTITASFLIFLASIMFALFNSNFFLFIIGRILFGLGGEIVACSSISFIRTFTKESNYSFFVGLFFASCRMLMGISSIVFVRIVSHFSLSIAFLIYSIFTLISLCSCIFACFQDKLLKERKLKTTEKMEQNDKTSFLENDVVSASINSTLDVKDDGYEGENLNKESWFIIISMFASFGIPLTIVSFFVAICSEKGINETDSSLYLSLHSVSACLSSIIGGYIYDRIGKRGIGHIVTLIILCLTPIALLTDISPIIIIFIQGAFYGIISVQSNGIISICLPNRLNFKALNYYYTLLNLGQTIITYIFAYLADIFGDYQNSLIFVCLFGLIFIVQMVILHFISDYPINQKKSGFTPIKKEENVSDPSNIEKSKEENYKEMEELISNDIHPFKDSNQDMVESKTDEKKFEDKNTKINLNFEEHKEEPTITDVDNLIKEELLCLAARENDAETVVSFLDGSTELNANFVDQNGKTALMYACSTGNEVILKALLDNNTKMDQDIEQISNLIDIAVELNFTHIVEILENWKN
eukprot:TRINITY_DN2703_c0_g1_i1.p1 TRINITY_DN2703_c0_g1~~TRINITY_DN2703_c0_g1_i1.p1  ORF type:complete len:607 (-),score=125.68 TRINITY_DN2703_c0_g1_i1:15-1835(-)